MAAMTGGGRSCASRMRSRRRSRARWRRRSVSSTSASSSIGNGGGSASARSSKSATSSSISPVASSGLTLASSRRARVPVAVSTSSERRRVGALVGLRRVLGVEHELQQAGAVAEVDEDQPAVVAPAVHPAGHAHLVAGAVGAQLAGPGLAVAGSARGPHAGRRRAARPPAPRRLHLVLLAAVHVLQLRSLVAQNRNVASMQPVRVLELALERAPGQFDLRVQARLAHLGGDPHALARVLAAWPGRRKVDVRRRVRLLGRGEQHALDPGREADARRRRAAERLHQPVVAPAAAHAALRAQVGRLELEHRARVVVQAAHERLVALPGQAGVVEHRGDGVEVLAVLGREAPNSRGAPAMTACVPRSLASKARSGLSSMRSRTSGLSASEWARRKRRAARGRRRGPPGCPGSTAAAGCRSAAPRTARRPAG